MKYASSMYHYFSLTLRDVPDGNSALCIVLEEDVGAFFADFHYPEQLWMSHLWRCSRPGWNSEQAALVESIPAHDTGVGIR